MAVSLVEVGGPNSAEIAFSQYYQAEKSRHMIVATGILGGDWFGAEDVLQTTMLNYWRHLPKLYFETESARRTYIRKSVNNAAIDQLRSDAAYRRRHVPMPERSENLFPAQDQDPQREQIGGLVRTALNNLPERQRNCIELKYYGGMSQAEIARELKTTEASVANLMHRGLVNMRILLTPVFEDGIDPQALTIDESDYDPEQNNPYLRMLSNPHHYGFSDIFHSPEGLEQGIQPVWKKLLAGMEGSDRVYEALMRKFRQYEEGVEHETVVETYPPVERAERSWDEKIFPPDALESGSSRDFQTLIRRLASYDSMPIREFFKQAEEVIEPSPTGGLNPKRDVYKPQDCK